MCLSGIIHLSFMGVAVLEAHLQEGPMYCMGVNMLCNPCYTTCTEIRGGHAQRIKVFNDFYIRYLSFMLQQKVFLKWRLKYIFKLIQVLRRKRSIIDTDFNSNKNNKSPNPKLGHSELSYSFNGLNMLPQIPLGLHKKKNSVILSQ